MLGAIAGDIIGSVFEWKPTKNKDFSLFHSESTYTDDTVLTVATAKAIIDAYEKIPEREQKESDLAPDPRRLLSKTGGIPDFAAVYKDFARRYPGRGYGGNFSQWVMKEKFEPYNSWGNGSAMRVSPVGFAAPSEEEVFDLAEQSAAVTHSHPEGIKGAQTVALTVYLARKARKASASYGGAHDSDEVSDKKVIRFEILDRFGYRMERSLDDIRPDYSFDVSCQGSVPEAIIAFLEAKSWEESVRNAISLGGDADTQACIAGGIAEAFYGSIPEEVEKQVRSLLPEEFLSIIDEFYEKFVD